MVDEVQDISTAPHMRVTEKDALALMKILFLRGYFHESAILSDGIQPQPNSKDDALLIVTSNGCYVTMAELRKRYIDLVLLRGRMTILESVDHLKVSAETLQRHVIPWVVRRDSCEEFTAVSSPNGSTKEVLSTAYLSDQIESLLSLLLGTAEKGMMLVSDAAASFLRLPCDTALMLLEKRIAAHQDSAKFHILRTDNAATALVTEDHLNFIRRNLATLLNDVADAPVCIKALARTNGWEFSWVLQMIKKEKFEVRGELHGGMFVPNSFMENQRRLVASSYSVNGFVTSHMCHAMFGISTSQMKSYATHDKMRDSYALLPNSVVNIDVIVAPLIEVVRLAMESTSWVDLKLHLPMDLLENETADARSLVENFVLNDDIYGAVCIRSDGALFFSEPMVKAFADERLIPLIKELAISRAVELLSVSESEMNLVIDEVIDIDGSNSIPLPSGKEKRKGRGPGKDSSNAGAVVAADDIGEFPIGEVVQALTEKYPDLSNLESSADVLLATCQKAFCTGDLESLWNASVRFEVERLRATDKKPASVSVGKCAAVAPGVKSIEAAFEDPGCFATSCYFVQAKAKFLLYAVQSSDRISNEMKQHLMLDFLDGCCLDFVYRITRYALFRNNVEDGIFHFGPTEGSAYKYYDPVDLGSSSYPKCYLSCVSKRNDALVALQEELPGGVGSALAKLWTLCGETHFQRESVMAETSLNEMDSGVSPVECFLSNARENCLIICGLPFAILDKKSEKKFLNSRRIRLMQLLDSTNDVVSSLDYTIMVLYQNCKNMVVSGSLLRGPVLKLLVHERKLTGTLSNELLSLAEKIERGEEVDISAVVRLKQLIASSTKGTS
jgi:E3 UFM1-protein ligase 1